MGFLDERRVGPELYGPVLIESEVLDLVLFDPVHSGTVLPCDLVDFVLGNAFEERIDFGGSTGPITRGMWEIRRPKDVLDA